MIMISHLIQTKKTLCLKMLMYVCKDKITFIRCRLASES